MTNFSPKDESFGKLYTPNKSRVIMGEKCLHPLQAVADVLQSIM